MCVPIRNQIPKPRMKRTPENKKMTPYTLIRNTAARFREAGIPDPENDSALLLCFLTGTRNPLSLRLDTDTLLEDSVLQAYEELAERRIRREPLQYITGEAPFFGRIFRVDPRVLIPRPETELLCEWALEFLPNHTISVLDLCCGSGCIGLTLAAERPAWNVTLSDLSPDALLVTRSNADFLGVRVSLQQGDLLEGLPDKAFDVILSNPPYIPTKECLSLQEEVRREPVLALDGGTDGLDFYRRIVSGASRVLKNGGLLMMELGFGEAEEVRNILSGAGYSEIRIRKDLNGTNRMIASSLPYGGTYV